MRAILVANPKGAAQDDAGHQPGGLSRPLGRRGLPVGSRPAALVARVAEAAAVLSAEDRAPRPARAPAEEGAVAGARLAGGPARQAPHRDGQGGAQGAGADPAVALRHRRHARLPRGAEGGEGGPQAQGFVGIIGSRVDRARGRARSSSPTSASTTCHWSAGCATRRCTPTPHSRGARSSTCELAAEREVAMWQPILEWVKGD